jgi:hypothetical protein
MPTMVHTMLVPGRLDGVLGQGRLGVTSTRDRRRSILDTLDAFPTGSRP